MMSTCLPVLLQHDYPVPFYHTVDVLITGWTSDKGHKIANVNVESVSCYPHKISNFLLFNGLLLKNHNNLLFLANLSIALSPTSKFFKVSNLLSLFWLSSCREKVFHLLFLTELKGLYKNTQTFLLHHVGTLFLCDMWVTRLGKEQIMSLWVPRTPSRAWSVHWEVQTLHQ